MVSRTDLETVGGGQEAEAGGYDDSRWIDGNIGKRALCPQ